MEETSFFGDRVHKREPWQLLAKRLNIDHSRRVVQIENGLHLETVTTHVYQEAFKVALFELLGGLRSDAKQYAQLHDELIARWQEMDLLDWPEPQGTPVVHRQLESAV